MRVYLYMTYHTIAVVWSTSIIAAANAVPAYNSVNALAVKNRIASTNCALLVT